MRRSLVFFVFTAGSCGPDQRVTYEDEGTLCLTSTDAGGEVSAAVSVCVPDDAEVLKSECTITQGEDGLRVSSSLRFEISGAAPGSYCSEFAVCTLSGVVEGRHALRFGAEVEEVSVPLGQERCLTSAPD